MAGTHHGFIMERAYGHPIRLWPQTHNVKMTVLAVTKQIRCSWEAFGMYDTHALGEDEGLKDELDIDAETYYKLVNDAPPWIRVTRGQVKLKTDCYKINWKNRT
jgi:hypothetical protein